jgi:hypothetical protein
MIARWGRTTQRVVPLSRLGESSDEGDVLRLNERGLPPLFVASPGDGPGGPSHDG